MRPVPRAGAALIAGAGALVLAGGVASAVVRSHHDAAAALPPVCRDNPGAAGGALPSGQKLQQLLGTAGSGSTGAPSATSLATSGGLGAGTPQQLQLRVQALAGGGLDTALAPSGTTPQSGTAQAVAPGSSGGDGAGSGGPGGAGTGGRSGDQTGPLGGSGQAPTAGQGPDTLGLPQQPQPVVSPPVVPPPVPPKVVHRNSLGAGGVLLLILGIAVLAGLLVLAARRTRRRPDALPDGTGLVPADADALAETALAAGDLDLALRWTFVSGLLQLDTVGVLPYEVSRPTVECAQWVRSAEFPVLAASFDLVAYGGRHATVEDVLDARQGWSTLIFEVTRRTDRARDVAVHGPLTGSRR